MNRGQSVEGGHQFLGGGKSLGVFSGDLVKGRCVLDLGGKGIRHGLVSLRKNHGEVRGNTACKPTVGNAFCHNLGSTRKHVVAVGQRHLIGIHGLAVKGQAHLRL